MIPDFNFGTGDWEIEFFLRPRALTRSFGTVVGNGRSSWTTGCRFIMLYGDGDARPGRLAVGGFDAKTGSGSYEESGNPLLLSDAVTLSAWGHVVVNKVGTLMRLWSGGAAAATNTSTAAWDFTLSGLCVGMNGWNQEAGHLSAVVHDLQVRRTPLRTAPFVPPPAPADYVRIFGETTTNLPWHAGIDLVCNGGTVNAREGLIASRPAGPSPATSAAWAPVATSAPLAASRMVLTQGQLVRDTQYGGRGRIFGTTKLKGTPDNLPVMSRVVLHHQRSRLPVRQTWSDPATGEYMFEGVDPAQEYFVMAEDAGGQQRAVAAQRLTPEEMP